MKCQRIERLLATDLGAAARKPVSEHLASCQRCRELYEDLCALEELKQALKDGTKAPEDFTVRVVSSLPRPSVWPGWRRSLLVVAASTLIGILGAAAYLQTASGELIGISALNAFSESQSGEVEQPEVGQVGRQPQTGPSAWTGSREEGTDSGQYLTWEVAYPDGEMILQMPAKIVIRKSELHDDFFLDHVSH